MNSGKDETAENLPNRATRTITLNQDYDYEAEKQRNDLLLRLKEQHQSAIIPRTVLYEVSGQNAEFFKTVAFAWSRNDGMGNWSLMPPKEKEIQAAHELLERGSLVRSFHDTAMGGEHLTRIQVLEDVLWGVDSEGILRMYQLGENIPDILAEMDERHDNAVHELQKRIDYGYAFIDETPLTLSNGLVLRPVIHGRNQKLIHDRQARASNLALK